MKNLKPFLSHQFSSNSVVETDFKHFAREFESYIKKFLPQNYTLHSYRPGHYCLCGVIRSSDSKFIYFSIPDVRYFENEWYTDILIRTMKHDKDWTGGSNQSTNLENFHTNIQKLY